MHELSIAQALLETVEAALGAPRPLLAASVTIGPLSGVEPEALAFCFTEVAEAMGFGRPVLRIAETRIRARCDACATEYEMKDFGDACPRCDAFAREILSGEELSVEEVELAEEAESSVTA